MPTKVLVVDDDPAYRRLCGIALSKEGIEFLAVATSQAALKAMETAKEAPFDLMLLDMELPGMKGWELLRLLRDRGTDIPVVLVSVREGVEDKVKALDLGADDYLVKPCAFDELVSRLQAVLRRIRHREVIQVGDLEIDPLLRRVRKEGRQIDLTPREIELLQILVEERGEVVSNAAFMSRVWKLDSEPTTNFLQVHVSRLKRKLRETTRVRIETVVGAGYRLVELDGRRD